MPDFRIIFLGTGTSVGVPMIGCSCAVCTSSDPRNNRTRSSIYIETPESRWVVDTGPEFRLQCLRERIHHLDAVVYTHAHMDHVVGFDDLRRFCDAEGFFLPVYGAPRTLDQIRKMFGFAFEQANHFAGYIRPDPRYVNGPFLLGETMLTPLDLPHGKFICNGFLFTRHGRKLAAYLSDCNGVPDEARQLLDGVEHLIIDGLRERPHPTHLTVNEAIQVGTAVKAEHVWLTHICHDLDHAETEAKLPESVRLAYDGLRLDIG